MAAPTNAANVKKALANREPSTHGSRRTRKPQHSMSASQVKSGQSRVFGAATSKYFERMSIQRANGGMPFVWIALLPTIVSLRGNSSAPVSGSRRNARRRAVRRSREPHPHRRVRRGRERQGRRRAGPASPTRRRAGCGQDRAMLRRGVEAGPALARCSVRRRANGAAGTVHRRRTGPGRRSVHAAPLRRLGREGAAAHIRAHQVGARCSEGEGRSAR